MVGRLKDRPTADLVVLALTAIIGLVIVCTLIGVLMSEIINPNTDVAPVVRALFDITGSLVTGVIGYIGGRAVGQAAAGESTSE